MPWRWLKMHRTAACDEAAPSRRADLTNFNDDRIAAAGSIISRSGVRLQCLGFATLLQKYQAFVDEVKRFYVLMRCI
jgi:hypothetical protein